MKTDNAVVELNASLPDVTVRTRSMEEAMSVGGLVFHRHTLQALDSRRPPQLTLKSHQVGPMTLGTIQYSSGARVVTGAVRDGYQVNIPLQGEVRTGRKGERVVASVSTAAVYGLHQHEFEGFESPTRMLGVKIQRHALERRLEQLLGYEIGDEHIEFELAFGLDSRRGREWFTIVHILARQLWASGALAEESLVQTYLQDAAMTGLLLAAPHSYRNELDDPAGAAAPRAVRRAVSVIDASPEGALLTVPELAAKVGVGIRALQAGFRAQLNTTPLAYLIDRRLVAARDDLRATAAEGQTVGEIAARWGFAHHGRFSVAYRQRFGESPSHTLRG